jgi:hypothetical protein
LTTPRPPQDCGVQEQALDATFSLVKPVDRWLGFSPFLPRDVEVHDILGGVFELAQLFLKTCITSKQNQQHVQPRHVCRLLNNEDEANLVGSPLLHDGCQLTLDRNELLLEELLSLSSACSDSRSENQDQSYAKEHGVIPGQR